MARGPAGALKGPGATIRLAMGDEGKTASDWLIWGAYFAAITLSEAWVTFRDPFNGAIGHAVILAALLIHGSFGAERDRPMLVALMFAPLIRILSLSLPFLNLPIEYWWALASAPLFVMVVPVVRNLGLTRYQLGLTIGNVPIQIVIALLGIPFGIIEYLILQPRPMVETLTVETVLKPALILLICTGLLEELIFRGVLQSTALKVIGRWGLVYVSLIFAALHIGYQSILDVVLVLVVGLTFGVLVARTGSILGVTLAHGLTNIILFIIAPGLAITWSLTPGIAVGPEAAPAPVSQSQATAVPLSTAIPAPASDVAGVGSAPTTWGVATRRAAESLAQPRATTILPTAVAALTHPQPAVPAAAAGDARVAGTPTAVSAVPEAPDTASGPTTDGASDQRQYVVRPGDTLTAIAEGQRTTVDELVRLNGLDSPNVIRVGQVLLVPSAPAPLQAARPRTYTVARGDTLWMIAERTGVSLNSLTAYNRLANRNLILPGQVLLLEPSAP